MERGPVGHGIGPGPDVGVFGGQADPVLQAVDGIRGLRVGVDEQQAGDLGLRQSGTAIGVPGPMHEDDIHARHGKDRILRACFLVVNLTG